MLKKIVSDHKDYSQECTECGAIVGDGVEVCPYCEREAAEGEGHYGYTDVWGNWICYSGCPACHPAEKEE